MSIRAQQPSATNTSVERERGIKLYNEGDDKSAVATLRAATKQHKEDADAWYYLGLALNRSADVKNARKAFETSIKLRPDFANAHTGLAYTLLLANKLGDADREATRALSLGATGPEPHYIISVVGLRERVPDKALEEAEAALRLNSKFAPALLIKSQALLGVLVKEDAATVIKPQQAQSNLNEEDRRRRRIAHATRYKEAAESLEKYLKLRSSSANEEVWREQLETLRVYAELADKSEAERTVFRSNEVITKVQILSKPEARFTEAARQHGTSGTIILNAVLAADGAVKHILVLQSLGDGLTEEAIKAARKIKFIPATINNRPVSVFVTLEYNLNFY